MWTLQQSHDITTAQLQCCGQRRCLLSYSISHCGNNHVKTTSCVKIQTVKKNSLAVTHVSLIFSAGLLIYSVKTTLSQHTVLVSSCFVPHVKMTSKIKEKQWKKKHQKTTMWIKGPWISCDTEKQSLKITNFCFTFDPSCFRWSVKPL